MSRHRFGTGAIDNGDRVTRYGIIANEERPPVRMKGSPGSIALSSVHSTARRSDSWPRGSRKKRRPTGERGGERRRNRLDDALHLLSV